ncbi:transcriptional regulator LysR family [Vibrio astriarenae]|nr:transcriptional regulator LysR family [Vibrio sp. C7]
MDIESLKLFVKVAETLNISAAGRALGLAPAMASARIAKLESYLGADLFHRSTRRVALSTEGEYFLPHAISILAQHDKVMDVIGADSQQLAGTIRFASSSTFAQLYVVPLLPAFFERYPNINLDMRLGDRPINIIEDGIDLALRSSTVDDSGLRARKLATDKRILCASPDYLSRYGHISVPADLEHHHIISFKERKPRIMRSSHSPQESVFPPTECSARLICDDGTSMRLATLNGVGVSMNSFWSVAAELKQGSLVQVLSDYEVDEETNIWLVYPKANALSGKVRVFIDFLVEKIGDPPIWERD